MTGTPDDPVPTMSLLEEWSLLVHDLYGSHLLKTVIKRDEMDAIEALKKMADKYGVPFEIVVALPIRQAWKAGVWQDAPPDPRDLFERALECHRELLLARDQHRHGRVSIVENLVPIRAIRRQLENDVYVMETVALHCEPDVTAFDVSTRGIHFVSEWWRVGEDILWEGNESNPDIRDYVLGNFPIHNLIRSVVQEFYARFE